MTTPADPTFAAAKAAFDAGRFAAARDLYETVLQSNEQDHAAHLNLAQCYKRLGDWTLATRHFQAGFQLRRRTATVAAAPLSAFRIDHLAEQLAHLRASGDAPWYDETVAAELARLAKLLRDCYGPHRSGPPPIAFDRTIMALADGCPHRPEPDPATACFNPSPQVTSVPLGHGQDTVHVLDNVLTEAALYTLRKFLTDATIWYDARPERRYLGAHLHDGLASDFLCRLIEAARACFARFVGSVRIIQVWAFKYAPTASGIDYHADQADWNLNIWPTETAANLDPASGGMTIARFPVPADWSFQRYNASPERHRAMLAASGVGEVNIPYRGNRAVLFPSRYLHRTNEVRFAPAYTARRINMTFMAEAA